MGSPTINNGYSYAVAGLLEMIKGLKFKNKKASAFGSYGWSGDAVKQISEKLQQAGITVVDGGIRELWVPDQEMLDKCVQYGQDFVKAIE